ncbi:hypothetical protein Mapa_006842 [Marchantia paleacea]|nr:hypothetical protein Mapa_006842 [Marchantia paleacea]
MTIYLQLWPPAISGPIVLLVEYRLLKHCEGGANLGNFGHLYTFCKQDFCFFSSSVKPARTLRITLLFRAWNRFKAGRIGDHYLLMTSAFDHFLPVPLAVSGQKDQNSFENFTVTSQRGPAMGKTAMRMEE